MTIEKIDIRPPNRLNRLLERTGLREVSPDDLCDSSQVLGQLYGRYPDLMGDKTAIGWGDEGRCQSWRDNPGWWKELLEKES